MNWKQSIPNTNLNKCKTIKSVLKLVDFIRQLKTSFPKWNSVQHVQVIQKIALPADICVKKRGLKKWACHEIRSKYCIITMHYSNRTYHYAFLWSELWDPKDFLFQLAFNWKQNLVSFKAEKQLVQTLLLSYLKDSSNGIHFCHLLIRRKVHITKI